MELTTKQQEGLKIAVERHRAGEKYTVIAGYAGTGKSTLVKFIIEALGVEKSVEYDESKQLLTVTFRDGFTAHYPDITKDVAQDFIEDESKGRFVWKHLYHHKYY